MSCSDAPKETLLTLTVLTCQDKQPQDILSNGEYMMIAGDSKGKASFLMISGEMAGEQINYEIPHSNYILIGNNAVIE
jgi:hypothetical protein